MFNCCLLHVNCTLIYTLAEIVFFFNFVIAFERLVGI